MEKGLSVVEGSGPPAWALRLPARSLSLGSPFFDGSSCFESRGLCIDLIGRESRGAPSQSKGTSPPKTRTFRQPVYLVGTELGWGLHCLPGGMPVLSSCPSQLESGLRPR